MSAEDESATVSLREVTAGHVVFLEPKTDDELGTLITQYDGGRFSHVGLVVDTGVLASARTSGLTFPDWRPDIGGVRLNVLAELLGSGRTAWAIRPPHAPSFEVIRRTIEFGNEDRSGFAFVKMFAIACALRSFGLEPDHRDPMLAAAYQFGLAFSSEQQRSNHQKESFFCSELVASEFGLQFTVADLRPPRDGRPNIGIQEFCFDIWIENIWNAMASLVRKLTSILKRMTPEQWIAAWRLATTVLEHDREVLGRAMEALAQLLSRSRPREATLELNAAEVPPVPSDSCSLPASLVTPRMIEVRLGKPPRRVVP